MLAKLELFVVTAATRQPCPKELPSTFSSFMQNNFNGYPCFYP
jgi:hypothetical protein